MILSLGFTQCHSNHTCFIRRNTDGRCIILFVYEDDIVITGDDAVGISQVKDLSRTFKVKDLGHLKYFFGIEIVQSHSGILMTQRKYILDLLNDNGITGCQSASTLIDLNLQLTVETRDLLSDLFEYQRLVGRLIYLTP